MKMLGQIVTLLYDAHAADPQQFPYPTILEIGRVLSAPDLSAATRKMRATIANRTGMVEDDRYSALIHPTQDEAKSASGFGAKLTQMYNTQVGRTVLRPDPTKSRPSLDVTAPGITYVGLDTQSKKDLSMIVSSAVLQRMSVFSGQRTRGEVAKSGARFIIIDEANSINRDIVKTILQKARAAGVVVVLCTQSPEDWIDERGDDWSTMAQNINFAVIMAQGSPHSAELCAEFIGEKNKLQVSQQVDMMEYGQKSMLRETVDFLVPPHQLRALSIGEAILRVNKPAERVTWLTVKKRDPSVHR
jgi:type IV secretory pathway TraG/TraD family ATPase VirD4